MVVLTYVFKNVFFFKKKLNDLQLFLQIITYFMVLQIITYFTKSYIMVLVLKEGAIDFIKSFCKKL